MALLYQKSPDFDKEAKIIQWKKESIFSYGAGITGCQHVKK